MSTINLAGGNTLLSTGAFPPVRAASTGSPLNPAAGGLLTVDGVPLAAGDRVLCKDEVNPVNNGIYAVQTGPWVRTADAQGNTQFFQGMTVTCGPQGAVNAGQTFVCTATDDPVVVGVSQLTFAAQAVVQTQQQAATSSTPLAIGTGPQTLTIQAGKAFQAGQWVLIQETSNAANQMLGQITSYSGTSLAVNVVATGGAGTHADWTIVLTNSAAAAGYQPPVGSGNVTGPGAAVAGHVATFADATGKVLQDGGQIVGGAGTITPAMFANAAVGYALGMLNGTLVASVAGSALTIAVKTLAGADPSPGDPVFFLVPGGSGWTPLLLASALSLTVPAGATLGTVSGQGGRQWIAVFNNGGTPVLGIYNALAAAGPSILCWDETSAANGTGISAGSTSPQIWYTATSVAAARFRVLGYVESTQPTAGQWTVAPSKVQIYGPGVKKPGDIVNEVVNKISASSTVASTTFVALSGQTVAINVQSAANVVRVEATGNVGPGPAGNNTSSVNVQLSRGTVAATNLFGSLATGFLSFSAAGGGSGQITAPSTLIGYDIPNVTGPVTYAVQGNIGGTSGNTATFGGPSLLAVREVQI